MEIAPLEENEGGLHGAKWKLWMEGNLAVRFYFHRPIPSIQRNVSNLVVWNSCGRQEALGGSKSKWWLQTACVRFCQYQSTIDAYQVIMQSLSLFQTAGADCQKGPHRPPVRLSPLTSPTLPELHVYSIAEIRANITGIIFSITILLIILGGCGPSRWFVPSQLCSSLSFHQTYTWRVVQMLCATNSHTLCWNTTTFNVQTSPTMGTVSMDFMKPENFFFLLVSRWRSLFRRQAD